MAKIDRYSGNMEAFAADALSTERTIFGDTAQSDTLDANITADFLRGWGVVGVNENPAKQDFNGLAFTLGQLIAYLHQRGIAEWNTNQEYYEGSVVTTLAGIYRLNSGGDGSSDPDTDGGVNWELAPTRAEVDAKAAISGQAFSGNISAPNLSGTNTGDQTKADIDALNIDAGTLDGLDSSDFIKTFAGGNVSVTEIGKYLDFHDIGSDADYDARISVSSTGNLTSSASFTAPNLSGTNTGDQDLSGKASLQSANITVTVGTGGDYPTINAALEYLSKLQPLYDSAGITATINLLAGFTMAEQVLVRGLNLGWITITGADAETTITHTALTTDFTTADYGFGSYPAFGVSKGGVLPRIGQLFRFNVANVGGNKHGIMSVGAGSSADIIAGGGVNDAGTNGIYAANGSTINAYAANASGAGSNGIHALNGSTINADGANASGAGTNGIYAYNGSTISAEGANPSSAGAYGISASRGSTINATTADASGAGTNGIYASNGSTINADGANASDAGTGGFVAYKGSTINATTADASGAGTYGIYALNGSTINAYLTPGTLSQAINTVTNNGIIFQ